MAAFILVVVTWFFIIRKGKYMDVLDSGSFWGGVKNLREQSPLVHCLTNNVVTNFTANVLLAIGASPAMVIAHEEAGEFAPMASAVLVNIGTLTDYQLLSMRLAVTAANEAGRPWVLDPVAAGVLKFRTDFCAHILQFKPAVVRGNASEISALAGFAGAGRGADSTLSSTDALEAAKILARDYSTVVALTGETDYVTDGVNTVVLSNGHINLTKITGAGCALSAMVAAYIASTGSAFLGAQMALAQMAVCGEEVMKQPVGLGSFAVGLLDQLSLLSAQESVELQCKKI